MSDANIAGASALRDAINLAKLHRAGELTPVWVPDQAHEAIRDLVRARQAAVRTLSGVVIVAGGRQRPVVSGCASKRDGEAWPRPAASTQQGTL